MANVPTSHDDGPEVTRGIRHHTKAQCDGLPCPFHGPSLHPMVEEPMLLRASGLIERTCRHGVGHPDPDSAAWLNRVSGQDSWGVHGCDGCCSKLVASGRGVPDDLSDLGPMPPSHNPTPSSATDERD